ncbi:hypothetical protein OCK74_08890 [Chitinophagaceae bacterium LB-8]|uniref:DUF6876 domain-containing protein n=1 Tax=Paraflavisolibacter caeni TaxID=2982496 RepID=A0A9X3B7I0_9BACT|nr:DUF6876 family protein [Paraflavisolibacter caeni]MCU7549230.1 hypothetical protein [Paraflavisolibacter caeni]
MTNANHFFGSSNGSERFFYHKPSRILITSGVKQLADTCSAYWFIDIITSHQCKRQLQKERFQVWDLKRINENRFTVVATDGNHKRIAYQYILYSDFIYDQATLWLVDGTLMLPKEY